MSGLTAKAISDLKVFVNILKAKPEILHNPSISFFKDYIESLGAKIPSPPAAQPEEDVMDEVKTEGAKETPKQKPAPTPEPAAPKEEPKPTPPPEEEKPEPDPDLIPAEAEEPNAEVGDPEKNVTEEEEGDAMSLMSEGRSAYRNKDYKTALEKYTEAIKKNPKGAVLFASRGECFLAMKKPNAARRDGAAALKLNPDSARGLKVHGKALRYLGEYEQAFKDLNHGNQLDYDDDTDAMIKSIKNRVEKLIERRRKAEIKKQEDDYEDRKRRVAEARKRAQEEEEKRRAQEEEEGDDEGGSGGGMPFPGFSDPEVQEALKDPATLQKLMAILQDPSKISQYANDPKIQRILKKMSEGGAGGFPGFGGFGGAPPPGGHDHGHDHSHDHDHDHGHDHSHESEGQSKGHAHVDDLD